MSVSLFAFLKCLTRQHFEVKWEKCQCCTQQRCEKPTNVSFECAVESIVQVKMINKQVNMSFFCMTLSVCVCAPVAYCPLCPFQHCITDRATRHANLGVPYTGLWDGSMVQAEALFIKHTTTSLQQG